MTLILLQIVRIEEMQENQKTVKKEDDIKAILNLSKLHNCCVSCSLDYLKSLFKSKHRLPIPEFCSSHCAEMDIGYWFEI